MGFRNGDEGEWIDLIDDVFHLFHLIPRNDTVDNIQVLTAVIAHPADKGNPATQIVRYLFGNFFWFRGNDKEAFSSKTTFSNQVDHKGVNQDKEEGIHSCADILEDYDNSYQNNGIDNQHEFSHGEGSVFVKDASEDICSSSGSSSIEDNP